MLTAERLSWLIKRAKSKGVLHGCQVSRTGPTVSHLLFADDSLFFFRASESECNVMKKILLQYEEASGQGVNFTKYWNHVQFECYVNSCSSVVICSGCIKSP